MGFLKRRKAGDEPWRDLGDFDLPTFPGSTLKTLEVLRSDETDAAEVAEALAVDPGLSLRVLRMVNSAAFGARRAVEELAHAVQLLGRADLESMVISVAVRDALPDAAAGFDSQRFWRAAATRAAVARRLAKLVSPVDAGAMFTAGMLCDMAVPLLAERVKAPYVALLERWYAGEGDLAALERDAFGWDHGEVGASMVEAWGLPEHMSEIIRGHHAEDGDRGPVAVAALLCEVDPEGDAERVAETAAAWWGREAETLAEAVKSALEEADELASYLC